MVVLLHYVMNGMTKASEALNGGVRSVVVAVILTLTQPHSVSSTSSFSTGFICEAV